MSLTSRQLALGPMALNKVGIANDTVGTETPTPANSVGTPVDLASIVLRAGDRLGLQRKDLAAVFGFSEADFSAAFSPNRTDRNRPMKQQLPLVLAREIALLMCEATGLAVAGPDAERNALADVMRSMADYLRVMQR
jgi:hypothetical protein